MPHPVQICPLQRAGCTPLAFSSGASSRHCGGQEAIHSPHPLHSSASMVTFPRGWTAMLHLIVAGRVEPAALGVDRHNSSLFATVPSPVPLEAHGLPMAVFWRTNTRDPYHIGLAICIDTPPPATLRLARLHWRSFQFRPGSPLGPSDRPQVPVEKRMAHSRFVETASRVPTIHRIAQGAAPT